MDLIRMPAQETWEWLLVIWRPPGMWSPVITSELTRHGGLWLCNAKPPRSWDTGQSSGPDFQPVASEVVWIFSPTGLALGRWIGVALAAARQSWRTCGVSHTVRRVRNPAGSTSNHQPTYVGRSPGRSSTAIRPFAGR